MAGEARAAGGENIRRPIMNWRPRKSTAAVAVIGMAVAAWLGWVIYQDNAEPVYEGRGLSEWLTAFEPNYEYWGTTFVPRNPRRVQVSERDARRAIRVMGTNCLPKLLEMLRADDPPARIRFLELLHRQHYFQPHITMANDLHAEAERAFSVLGEQAQPAVPELIRLFNEDPSPQTRSTAASLLSSLGSAADAAVPCMEKATHDTNLVIASAASNVLSILRPAPSPLIWDAPHRIRSAKAG